MDGVRGDDPARPGRLRFGVLGPLEVTRDGVSIDLGPRKQRAVLAILLLNANRVVPTSRLIDDLWGDAPPETARSALQVHIAGLRKTLGDGGSALVTRAPGYVLTLDPGALDLHRFVELRDRARAARDVREKSALLHEALDLWRDIALADLDGEPFAAAARANLEELRLAALEERIEADLELGRHARLVPELDALVAEHPYRERLRGQQMLALYRSGRQADALAAYRAAREASVEDLGLEPGPELKALERAMLDQDPHLDAPVRVPAPTTSPPRARERRRLSVWSLGIVLGSVLAGLAAIVALTRDDAPRVVVPPNSVAVIDPATNKVVQAVQVGLRPGPITAGGGAVWAGNLDERNLTRIDMRTRRPAGTVSLGGRSPTGLAFDRSIGWVAHGLLGSVSRVDARFTNVTGVTEVTEKGTYSSAGSVAADPTGSVWALFGDGTLARLGRGGNVEKTTSTFGSPEGVVVGYGSVWVVSASQSAVQRFSPLSLAEVDNPITVGSRPTAIVAGFGDVWVASAGLDLVYRIDIGAGSIRAPIAVGDDPSAIAVGAGAVWVASKGSGTVSRIDPKTDRVVKTIDVGEAPAGLVVAGNLVWVTVQAR